MTLSAALEALLAPLLTIATAEWKQRDEYKLLKRLACERLSRELAWNAECMIRAGHGQGAVFAKLLRTNAFDMLVEASAPIDLILNDEFRLSWIQDILGCEPIIMDQLESAKTISELVDHCYHRIWMIKHVPEDLERPEVLLEVFDFTVITLAHILIRRNSPGKMRESFQKCLSKYIKVRPIIERA
jgi:hypothetical protein